MTTTRHRFDQHVRPRPGREPHRDRRDLVRPFLLGGPYNVESKLLLFTHAFEDLRLARLALRTDNLNVRSQQALARLGLVHEGTLRSHMRRPDGTRRDSLYYSLLADEWPTVRETLRARVTAKTTPLLA